MQAYTYISKGKFELVEKPKPVLYARTGCDCKGDTLPASVPVICTSSTEVCRGRSPGITVGHEMVGIVEEVGQR